MFVFNNPESWLKPDVNSTQLTVEKLIDESVHVLFFFVFLTIMPLMKCREAILDIGRTQHLREGSVSKNNNKKSTIKPLHTHNSARVLHCSNFVSEEQASARLQLQITKTCSFGHEARTEAEAATVTMQLFFSSFNKMARIKPTVTLSAYQFE